MMRFRCAFVNPPEPMNFEAIAQFFPVILAPGVVALARGRWPGVHRAVDGLIVWLAVIGAAVVWAVLLGAAFGEPFGPDMVRRGFVLGLVSACAHTWATFKKPAAAAPSIPPPAETPFTATAPLDASDYDFRGSP